MEVQDLLPPRQMNQEEKNLWASKSQSKCLQNAKDNEPVFVLRGQDDSSPAVVLDWIQRNFESCPDDKLRDAFECALAMKNYTERKVAD